MASMKKTTKPAPAKPANPLLDGGDERGQSDRWTHDDENVGTTLLARLVDTREITFGDGKTGTALLFAPAVELTTDGELIAHARIETIFSAALATKIAPATDTGRVFGIRYDGTEKSKKAGRTAFKLFTIVEHDASKLAKALNDLGETELATSLDPK